MERAERLLKGKPFFVGDEAAVLRFTRPVKRRRRMVEGAFLGGIALLATAVSVLGVTDVVVGGLSFGALSSGFIIAHLAVGKRKWMAPLEAFDDGVEGSEVTLFFCRRRFVTWGRVLAVELVEAQGERRKLLVRFSPSRALESAPGEVDAVGLAALQRRWDKVKAQAAADLAIFESVGKERRADG